MKILEINDIDEESKNIIGFHEIKLFGVIIKYINFWGQIKYITAYPSNIVGYYRGWYCNSWFNYYVNQKNGKLLSSYVSYQINNYVMFCHNKKIKK